MKKIVAIGLSAMLIAGCSQIPVSRVDIAQRAKLELIGMSKSEILECAGVPLITYKYNDTENLIYSNQDNYAFGVTSVPGSKILQRVLKHDECETTLKLINGAVESVNYNSNYTDAMATDAQCAYVFERCLSKQETADRPLLTPY